MIPNFDIEGGLPLALCRFASVAGLVAAFGSLFYARFLRPAGLAEEARVRLHRLCMAALGAAGVGALTWLVAQTVDFAGDAAPDDVWEVLIHTAFGHLLAARVLCLALAWVALVWRAGSFAALLAGVALLLQAGSSHAAAMGGSPMLLASAALHLLAAGVWLGGLPALWITLSGATPTVASAAARRFSPAGMLCVAILLATATLQFSDLVIGIPGLVGTAYGWMAGLKILLFAILIGLAARNRFWFTPALSGADAASATRRLMQAVSLETVIGLLVLAAAGVLSELQPAMHTQPLWPFTKRFSLETINEDPDFFREVMEAALALAGAVGLVFASLLARRFRWSAFITLSVVAWFAVPHFSLLLVEANPYSFFHSPTDFAAADIVEGAALYPMHCAVCHGAEGRGDGPLAKTLPVPPADLTAGHLWMHSDGDLFAWLTNGIEAPRGGQAMPGFAKTLSEQERWALIDYVHAHNAGNIMQQTGAWSPPLRAPAFAFSCAGRAERSAALHGQLVRIILGGVQQIDPQPGMTTILAAGAQAPAGVCMADDPAVAQAFAIVSGAANALPAGTEFLIDGDGWLRAMQKPGASPPWTDPQALAAAIEDLRTHKVMAKAPMPMNMPM